MRKAEGALVVFDVTNRKTFTSVPYWVETLREKALEENVQIVLVGNKVDRAQFRAVSVDEAEDMARNLKVSYRETAVSDSSTLAAAFRDISERTCGVI
jgi:GTPase SAR1 family protein